MACRRRPPCRARLVRDIPDDVLFSRRLATCSQQVENFVDNHDRAAPRLDVALASGFDAQKAGKKKSNEINDLPSMVVTLVAGMVLNASSRAAVELSSHSPGRFGDG